jgi:O-acetyl-ADP-ribose deacetylase (regulator of RNase III)
MNTFQLTRLRVNFRCMAYREYKGNLFASRAQCLVNTVNCVGVMGKGVALEFRHRFPKMYEEYRQICESGALRPGQIWPYRKDRPWVLNFAVKDDWKHPSRIEWVESCLDRFVINYQRLGIHSVAMPWLGAMNGRLEWNEVHSLIRSFLSNLPDVSVELVEFDPHEPDPLFEKLRSEVLHKTPEDFRRQANIPHMASTVILAAIIEQRVNSLSEICALEGLGKKTIDNLYSFLISDRSTVQEPSFNQPVLL